MIEPKLTSRDWIAGISFIIFLISYSVFVLGFLLGKAYPYAFICGLASLFISGMFHRVSYWQKYNSEKEFEEKYKDGNLDSNITVKIS